MDGPCIASFIRTCYEIQIQSQESQTAHRCRRSDPRLRGTGSLQAGQGGQSQPQKRQEDLQACQGRLEESPPTSQGLRASRKTKQESVEGSACQPAEGRTKGRPSPEEESSAGRQSRGRDQLRRKTHPTEAQTTGDPQEARGGSNNPDSRNPGGSDTSGCDAASDAGACSTSHAHTGGCFRAGKSGTRRSEPARDTAHSGPGTLSPGS